MANTQSAIKRIRSSARKRARNRAVRSAASTQVKKLRALIAQGRLEEAETAVTTAYRVLDKATAKGVLHPNNAARRKSRLMARLNRAKANLA